MTLFSEKKKPKLIDSFDFWIIQWNNEHPLDRWWREKHKVSFGSKQHLEASHLQMFFEFRESELYLRSLKKKEDDLAFNDEESEMLGIDKPSSGSKRIVRMDKSDIDSEFDKLDPTSFGTPSGKGSETNIL